MIVSSSREDLFDSLGLPQSGTATVCIDQETLQRIGYGHHFSQVVSKSPHAKQLDEIVVQMAQRSAKGS